MLKRGIYFAAACSICMAAGASAAESTTVAPKAEGEVRTLPGGAVLHFSKDAKYEMGRPIKLQLAPTGSPQTPVQVLKLSKGRLTIQIPEAKNPKTAVLVQGPRKVSAVAKGGESSVIATTERVTVAAVRGEMLAALGNDWKPLASGRVRSFAAAEPEETPVLGPPKLTADHTVLLALGGSATAQVGAQQDGAADHRELTLTRVDGSARSELQRGEWRSELQTLQDLTPGRYEVVARAVDRFGVESASSEPLTLRVIGAELPEGARIVSGSILLGRNGRVKLIGASGLEASYGRATLFIPAPTDVGLARGDSTLLRLREPGAKEELGIQLEPRTLRADVEIGPKDASWPKDSLAVSVKLFDHGGKPVTEPLKEMPHVFVNVDTVAATWTHSGNVWTTKVAPAVGPGPWVVRVEVSDDFGEAVGRDFIELKGQGS